MTRAQRTAIALAVGICGAAILGIVSTAASTKKIPGGNGIAVLEFVEANGTRMASLTRGRDRSNPVAIFVHGGPGCPEIPYIVERQAAWEERLTIVHYDQRGCGKSYRFFEDYGNLSADLLADDLVAFAGRTLQKLGKDKAVLIGHSFGTYVALLAAQRAPELFSAYVGIGQMADTAASEIDGLEHCLEQAKAAGNEEHLAYLEGIEERVRTGLAFVPRKYLRAYGGAARGIDDIALADFPAMVRSDEYSLVDILRYRLGVGLSQRKLLADVLENPISSRVAELAVPCYFVMGKHDLMTSEKQAKKYFDSISAPRKEYVLFEESAHYPHLEESGKFSDWLGATFG